MRLLSCEKNSSISAVNSVDKVCTQTTARTKQGERSPPSFFLPFSLSSLLALGLAPYMDLTPGTMLTHAASLALISAEATAEETSREGVVTYATSGLSDRFTAALILQLSAAGTRLESEERLYLGPPARVAWTES